MMANYNDYSDEQLAVLFNQQDKYAFETIYGRYKDILYIHAKKMLQDQEAARDAVQELFTNLFAQMGSFELKSTIQSYLFSSISRRIVNQMIHEKVKLKYVNNAQFYQKRYVADTDHPVLEKDLIKNIAEEIERLPPKMKAIFEMSRKAYMNNQDIAQATNTTTENVRRQLRIALERLRGKLTCFFCLQIMAAILWLNRTF